LAGAAANERPDRRRRRDRLQPATCSGASPGNRRSFIGGQLVLQIYSQPIEIVIFYQTECKQRTFQRTLKNIGRWVVLVLRALTAEALW
jgi:hypothetical protein